ncbi:DNA adenine methylase [Paenibacillus sp. 3LSP]|uniref:DNA adenine methylase n=1 Tax=Paenibacillus TaxID=44249 RepID=UPI00048F4A3F|nr:MULTISPECIES: DNA adenine methylase [Paenibacillus]MDU0330542.1 DNA adenine methylase [Paenibacillus sp. 3LSP]SMF00614.1 DNA adenine methylase [Paenibacillus barengoltzii]
MAKSLSPLRYPGGKSKIYDKVKTLIEINAFGNKTYIEPFAGGFGIGIGLLRENVVQTAVLNDFDSHIYHFWYSVFHHTDELLKMIVDTPITLEERKTQQAIYDDSSADALSDGFATLFLNRVNFSGIIKGGPLGGESQSGKYKLDCRFNKEDIKKKIENIALLKNRITIYNCDASDLIINKLSEVKHNAFFNIDPPYVIKGNRLYTNYFEEDDHINLERVISQHLQNYPWIVTYDNCELIRDIYSQYHLEEYYIQHNAGGSVLGKELVITNIPNGSFVW